MPTIDPVLFYVATFALAALCLLLVGVIALYLRLSKKYVDVKAKVVEDAAEVAKEREKILEDAHKSALATVEDARVRAESVVANAQNFNKGHEEELIKEIQNAGKVYEQKYIEALQLFAENATKVLQNTSKDLKKSADAALVGLETQVASQAAEFKTQLGSEVEKFQKLLSGVAEEARQKSEAEFEKVKQERLKELDAKMLTAVNMVAKDFLEKGLTESEHEQAIKKALEKAKEEGVFS